MKPSHPTYAPRTDLGFPITVVKLGSTLGSQTTQRSNDGNDDRTDIRILRLVPSYMSETYGSGGRSRGGKRLRDRCFQSHGWSADKLRKRSAIIEERAVHRLNIAICKDCGHLGRHAERLERLRILMLGQVAICDGFTGLTRNFGRQLGFREAGVACKFVDAPVLVFRRN